MDYSTLPTFTDFEKLRGIKRPRQPRLILGPRATAHCAICCYYWFLWSCCTSCGG
jgi:hypothetical protein